MKYNIYKLYQQERNEAYCAKKYTIVRNSLHLYLNYVLSHSGISLNISLQSETYLLNFIFNVGCLVVNVNSYSN